MAGEGVCAALAALNPGIRFTVPRLPRLASDQTSERESAAAPALLAALGPGAADAARPGRGAGGFGDRFEWGARRPWRREKRIASFRELLALIREDLRYNGGILWPGFQALAVYRFGVWKDSIAAKPLRIPFTIVYRLAYAFVRNFYGIELPVSPPGSAGGSSSATSTASSSIPMR